MDFLKAFVGIWIFIACLSAAIFGLGYALHLAAQAWGFLGVTLCMLTLVSTIGAAAYALGPRPQEHPDA